MDHFNFGTMVTFPTTPKAFVAFQEAGMGRKLTYSELVRMSRAVEILNECYASGRTGNPPSDMENGCCNSIQFWSHVAYEQGRREAQP